MNQVFASLPKGILAVILIGVGFALIVANDPPKTICDSQLEIFRESQKDFLYSKTIHSVRQPAVVQRLYETCQADNSPGGCFDLFQRLKKLDVDLRNVPGQCSEAAGADEAVHAWLFKTLALFSQVAWGDRGPASGQQKTAWFDLSDLALFCQLKQDAFRLYGPDAFNDWRNKQVGSLPGAQELADGQALAKSIFSINCEALRSL